VRARPVIVLIVAWMAVSFPARSAWAQSYYDVEIVVFELLGAEGVPALEADEPATPAVEVPPPDARFEPLPPERMLLAPEYHSLRSSKQYRPLVHLGWRQQVLGPRQSVARPLYEETQTGVVEGLLRVYSESFLHVDLDLTLHVAGDGSYRLNDSRRVRSGETHYFDHPRFGVLLRLTPS
jgi:hypothetical protein